MSKDSDDCILMNELFDSGVHWRPVALYNYDDTKIRELTKEEQQEWLKKHLTAKIKGGNNRNA